MTSTERVLRAILDELRALRAVLAPDTKPKPKGGASVASLTVNATTGEVRESDDGGDVPSALTPTERAVMRAQDKHGRLRPGRRADTKPFREEGE